MKKLILKSIRWYQKNKFFHLPIWQTLYLSDRRCRFTPTCSEYCFQAIKKYDMIKGVLLSLKRISRCHPWSQGGNDPLI